MIGSGAAIKTAYGDWEAELKGASSVMVHSKVIVVDPFGANPVVMTGSHNMGYKASHSNDDNLNIIEGNPALARAYAANIVAVFQEYRWRSYVATHTVGGWKGLAARTLRQGTPEMTALAGLEKAAADLDGVAPGADPAPKRTAFRAAQTELRSKLMARPATPDDPTSRWLITDLVTLGAPLAHAQVLLATDADDLADRVVSRELPSCPPVRERLDGPVLAAAKANGQLPIAAIEAETRLMCYPGKAGSGTWTLHHAAPFAIVRWTNVYDDSSLIYRGDIISGPVAGNFGQGIVDIDLAEVDRPSLGFTHTRYWDATQSKARLDAVRRAINLLDA